MRIASLLPAATEIVVALGLADHLVAVTFECAAPIRAWCPVVVDTVIPADLDPAQIDTWVRERAARGLPLYELDRAALAAATPDLILTQDLCRVCALPAATVAEACRVIGTDAEVMTLDPHSVDDVLDAVVAVGRAAAAPDAAAALTGQLRERLAAVRRAVAGRPLPRVLVLEWTDPPYLAGHWVPELVRRAGGHPVGALPGERSVAAAWTDLPEANSSCSSRRVATASTRPWRNARPSRRGCPACRSWRSTRRATSCRPDRPSSTGSSTGLGAAPRPRPATATRPSPAYHHTR